MREINGMIFYGGKLFWEEFDKLLEEEAKKIL